jgi:hypothetical protein
MTEPQLNVWEKALGWRKRQMIKGQITNEVTQKIRNDALEEVALEIEKMKAFGNDTVGSFAAYVRSLKT